MHTGKTFSSALACKRILYVLVLTLVFEGLIRKVLPSALGIIIFFLKDIFCIAGLYFVINTRLSRLESDMASIWRKVAFGFVPLILYSTFLDPPLGLFGTKEYILYIVVALLVPIAFPAEKVEELKRFILTVSVCLIPTTVIAIIQNALPATHWLNLTVGGTTMEEFSAGGRLRVSSTFSFTGQFSFFLNAVAGFLGASFFMIPRYKTRSLQKYDMLLLAVLSLMMIIGVFISGGRTAVLGSGACIILGFVLIGRRYPSWLLTTGIAVGFAGFIAFSAIRVAKPEYFAAYEDRSKGNETVTHTEEVEGRMFNTFTMWTTWVFRQDIGPIILGQGLGVMSNGSDQISSYARSIRSTGMWTETDIDNTMWEGGLYLAIIWYTMRIYIMLYCYGLWKSTRSRKYVSASGFFLANVIIIGITGTLGIQPPLAIWWWLSVGSVIAIKQCDTYLLQQNEAQRRTSSESNEAYIHEEIISV